MNKRGKIKEIKKKQVRLIRKIYKKFGYTYFSLDEILKEITIATIYKLRKLENEGILQTTIRNRNIFYRLIAGRLRWFKHDLFET